MAYWSKQSKMERVWQSFSLTKAVDSIGHDHIKLTMHSLPFPSKLRNVINNLTAGNYTRIKNKTDTSNPIYFCRGIFQGPVLSPEILNHCVDFILHSLSEKEVSTQFGFGVSPDLDPISCLGFVDDTALIARDTNAANELFSMSLEMYSQIGLDLNISKTLTIVIQKENWMKIHSQLTQQQYL